MRSSKPDRAGSLKIRVYSQNGHVCTQFTDDGPGLKDPKPHL